MRLATIVVLASALFTAPGVAEARQQFLKDNVSRMVHRIGVHANTSFRKPVDADVTKGITFGASIGLRPGQTNGWKFPLGFAMYSEYLHGPTGQQFGVLRTRALMAGIGYGWHVGRLSLGASAQTGFSVNRAVARGDAADAFAVAAGGVAVHAGNAMLLRPQVKAEYFITPRFTVRMSADYVMMRPNITVTTPAGVIGDRWNASSVHANIGIGVYPFHK